MKIENLEILSNLIARKYTIETEIRKFTKLVENKIIPSVTYRTCCDKFDCDLYDRGIFSEEQAQMYYKKIYASVLSDLKLELNYTLEKIKAID